MIVKEALQVLRAVAALPAAGAESAPLTITVNEREFLTLKIQYTRGAAGGNVSLHVIWQTDPDATLGDTADGVIINGIALNDEIWPLPPPADASAHNFLIPLDVPPTAIAFVGTVFESGVPATPGTCGVTAAVARQTT